MSDYRANSVRSPGARALIAAAPVPLETGATTEDSALAVAVDDVDVW